MKYSNMAISMFLVFSHDRWQTIDILYEVDLLMGLNPEIENVTQLVLM